MLCGSNTMLNMQLHLEPWEPTEQLKLTGAGKEAVEADNDAINDTIQKAQTFYSRSNQGHMIPRNLFIDLEASVVQQIKKRRFEGSIRRILFHSWQRRCS